MSAIIAAYLRSPFTPAHKGQLAQTRPDDIIAQVMQALLKQAGIAPKQIDDVLMGCAFPEGEQGFNIGRMAALLAGFDVCVPGATINRWCGSSMEAIHIAAGNIMSGKGDAFLACGVESMTRIAMGGFNPLPNAALYAKMPEAYISMGITAENVAKAHKIDRAAQEAFALASHEKAAKADFSKEIVAIQTADGMVEKDGCIRAGSTLEDLAKLNPAFDAKGSVTAATSSPLTDGAAATLVVSEDFAKTHKLSGLARIKSMAVIGLDPATMGLGPVSASELALKRAGISVKDLDIIEINEAFAAQAIPCGDMLGVDPAKTNIHGGAIALGHPLGASGARITGKAALLLHDSGGKYALAAACIGGGMGIATVLEKI
jgi:acetyl-CoA acyltransferase